jgi:hypothetical protein
MVVATISAVAGADCKNAPKADDEIERTWMSSRVPVASSWNGPRISLCG